MTMKRECFTPKGREFKDVSEFPGMEMDMKIQAYREIAALKAAQAEAQARGDQETKTEILRRITELEG